MARVTVKVHPRAKRSAITGRLGDAWKLDLAAPPVDGKANEKLVEVLAEYFNKPKRAVSILRGESGREKVVEIL